MKYILYFTLIILLYSCNNERFIHIKLNLINLTSDSIYINDIDRVILTNNINTLNGGDLSFLENSFNRNIEFYNIKAIEPNVFIIDSIPAKYYSHLFINKRIRSRIFQGYIEELKLEECKGDTAVFNINIDELN